MKNRLKILLVMAGLLVVALLTSFRGATADAKAAGQGWKYEPFKKAKIYLEFNQTVNDMGVHIDTDHNVGLRGLRVVAPNDKAVLNLEWRDQPPVGLTELNTESAEPSNEIQRVLTAHPAGEYTFLGRTTEGTLLVSKATLSHSLLSAPSITAPTNGADTVSTTGVAITWTSVPKAQGYVVEVKNSADGSQKIELSMPATSQVCTIPDGFLRADSEYQIGVASLHENGNLGLAESRFRTKK